MQAEAPTGRVLRPHERVARRCAAVALSVMSVMIPLGAAAADAEHGRATAAAQCAACHNADGNAPMALFPVLAGQNAAYLVAQLTAFKTGKRANPMMSGVAAALSDNEIADLAAWFAQQTPTPVAFTPDAAQVAAGQAVADQAMCVQCHLDHLQGMSVIPRLKPQHPAYLAAQLKAYRAGARTTDLGQMQAVVKGLSDADIDALAQWVATRAP